MEPERATFATALKINTTIKKNHWMSPVFCVIRRTSLSFFFMTDIGADKSEQLAEPGIMIPYEFGLYSILIH